MSDDWRTKYDAHRKWLLDHWFPDHVATVHEDGAVIDWRKPGTGIYAVRYRIDGRLLIVTGDVGDAIYQWSDRLTLGFLAGCDAGYFAEKCVASEHGRGAKEWDAEYAAEHVKELAAEYEVGAPPPECTSNEWEWYDFVSRSDGQAYALWSDIGSPGNVIALRTLGHLRGLKMAHAQLTERAGCVLVQP